MAGQISQRPRRFNPHVQNSGGGAPASPVGTPPPGTPPPAPSGAPRKGRHIGTRGIVIVLLLLICVAGIIGIFYGGPTSIIILGICAVVGAGAALLVILVDPTEVKDFFDRCNDFLKWLITNKTVSIFSLSLNILLLVSLMVILLTHPSPFTQVKVPNTATATSSNTSVGVTATPLSTSGGTPSNAACTAPHTPKQVAYTATPIDIPCTSSQNDGKDIPQDEDLVVESIQATSSSFIFSFQVTSRSPITHVEGLFNEIKIFDETTENSYAGAGQLNLGQLSLNQPQPAHITFHVTPTPKTRYMLDVVVQADRYITRYQSISFQYQ